MLRKLTLFIFFLLLFILFASNKSQLTAIEVINAAINYHGGMQQYLDLKTFSYKKEIWSYDIDGEEYRHIEQHIAHDKRKPIKGTIKWLQEEHEYEVICDKDCYRNKDGKLDTLYSPKSALTSYLSADYVAFMPYKLLDPEVELSYLGTDTLEDGPTVHVVEALYDEEKPSHSKTHSWWYYFNVENYRFEACKVDMSGRISLIKNTSFDTVNGMIFHEKRKSYRCDSLGNIVRLTTDYHYKYD